MNLFMWIRALCSWMFKVSHSILSKQILKFKVHLNLLSHSEAYSHVACIVECHGEKKANTQNIPETQRQSVQSPVECEWGFSKMNLICSSQQESLLISTISSSPSHPQYHIFTITSLQSRLHHLISTITSPPSRPRHLVPTISSPPSCLHHHTLCKSPLIKFVCSWICIGHRM
ncbi:hypothetical protein AMELA_G00198430 [Ameiurus melas]|uniref:Uncharacterized protein n=1 Tax=Ameiurus melas TaxID=219545 RepID=A0A7J6A8P3_AMEME|nr:hypothetical protein AMELA_G00198430 [Ameiurus melas]